MTTNSDFEASMQTVDGRHKEETGVPPFQPIGKPAPECSDILGRALWTTWYIHHECGDRSAIRLFEQMHKQGGGAKKIGQHLTQALPRWCRANNTRTELCALLTAQFSRQPETAQVAVEETRLRVKDRCIDFACTQYGDTKVALNFGAILSQAAWGALDIPQTSQAQAASAILRGREQIAQKRHKDRVQLNHLLEESTVSPKLREAVAADLLKVEEEDPIIELLRQFFSVKSCYWLQFFDKRDRLRRKKLPNFPTMRKRLVGALLASGGASQSPSGHELKRKEARELAAICMKAAYPGIFPKSLDGESVRLAMQYHEQMESRSVSVVRPNNAAL
jgi:hypothetical protein